MPEANVADLRREYVRVNAERDKRRSKRDPLYYSPHSPSEKQSEFLSLTCLESLYGGAAGGGKSDALLMAALQYVHVPGYTALILRRTYSDLSLPGAIMDRAKEWLIPRGVKWSDGEKTMHFPSGARLVFGYLDKAKDRYRYQSANFHFVGFDELTQFPELWYRFMFSRLRKSDDCEVPLRMRGATNPGGIGHEWVRRRFIDGDGLKPFIPALLSDNPYVDGDSYRASLAELDATTRRQMLEGVWVRDADGLVYQFTDAANVISAAPVLQHYMLGIDYGFRDATAFTVVGWRANDPNVYVVKSYKKTKLTPSAAAEEVLELSKGFSFSRIIGDVGGLGKGYAEEARARFSIPVEAADKQNKRGYISLFNGELERGRIKVVRDECKGLLDEWNELPWNEDRSGESEGFDNHQADSALYVWRAVPNYHERAAEEGPPVNSPEWFAAREKEMLERDLEREEQSRKREEWMGDV